MKFHYMHINNLNPENLKLHPITVTFAYQDDKFSFAIKSPKDNFNKKIGRTIAKGRYLAGHNYDFSVNENEGVVKSIENTFMYKVFKGEVDEDDIPNYFIKALEYHLN